MKRILFCCLLIFSLNSKAQDAEQKIEWSPDLSLEWSDFKAKPEESSDYSANTNSGISYGWSYSTDGGAPRLEHEVHAYFKPESSWVVKADASEELLVHERLHFDITELHARMLRKKLSEYEPARNIRRDLKRIYEGISKDRQEMQDLFDRETNHGENTRAQLEWQHFVKSELEKYADHSS